jgi:hypothetical protein
MRRLAEPDPEPLIVVSGLLGDDDRIEIHSVLRLDTGPTPDGEPLGGVHAELLDERGAVLARAPVMGVAVQPSCGCGGGAGGDPPVSMAHALLRDSPRGAALRILRAGEEVWSRRAPAEPPTVDDVSAELDERELRVRWRTSASDEYGIERAVRWSSDEGRSWQTFALGLGEDEAVVPVEALTSGPALVQVLVSDGFYTTAAEPVRVDVPRRPPQLAILWPMNGSEVRRDAAIRLWGVATASDGRTLTGDALAWELDGDRIGTGVEVWARLRGRAGEHRCTLAATDGELRAEATVVFRATVDGSV